MLDTRREQLCELLPVHYSRTVGKYLVDIVALILCKMKAPTVGSPRRSYLQAPRRRPLFLENVEAYLASLVNTGYAEGTKVGTCSHLTRGKRSIRASRRCSFVLLL